MEVDGGRQKRWKLKVDINGVKLSSFKHVELWQNHLLSLNTERLRHCVIDLQKPLVIVM